MADNPSWRETQDARREQAGDFLKAEGGRAIPDIRQKLVEEAWSGSKQTPRQPDHQEPLENYLGKRDQPMQGTDIHGNGGVDRPSSVPRPEASYERANREYQQQETGIERPAAPSQDIHGNGGEKSEGRSFDSMLDERYGHRIDDRSQGLGQDRSQQQEQSIDR